MGFNLFTRMMGSTDLIRLHPQATEKESPLKQPRQRVNPTLLHVTIANTVVDVEIECTAAITAGTTGTVDATTIGTVQEAPIIVVASTVIVKAIVTVTKAITVSV